MDYFMEWAETAEEKADRKRREAIAAEKRAKRKESQKC